MTNKELLKRRLENFERIRFVMRSLDELKEANPISDFQNAITAAQAALMDPYRELADDLANGAQWFLNELEQPHV